MTRGRATFMSVVVAAATAVAQDPPPNFVIILNEGQGWSSTSVAMDDRVPASKSALIRTPALETLARQGMRFSDAYTSLPRCTPARAALETGRNPAELHMTYIGEGRKDDAADAGRKLVPPPCVLELPPETVTVAELLKGAGYATAHFGKWHLGRANPAAHGFDEHDGANDNGGPEKVDEPNPKEAFALTEKGLAFMERQASAGKPFLLQLSHYAGRSPAAARPETLAEVQKRGTGLKEKELGGAAVAQDIDATIGMVLRKIDELGIAGRTYVIYTSDHGTPGPNKPLAGGKGTLAEGGLRVPFMVAGPGIAPGSVSHVRVILTDLIPTVTALAGCRDALPREIEGGSLLDVLKNGGTGEVRRAHGELVFHYPHYDHGNEGPASAILAGDFKLVVVQETGARHLYNIAADPGERRDLASELPDKTLELERVLESRLAGMNVQRATVNAAYDPAAAPAESGNGGRKAGGGRKRP